VYGGKCYALQRSATADNNAKTAYVQLQPVLQFMHVRAFGRGGTSGKWPYHVVFDIERAAIAQPEWQIDIAETDT